ncbi:MAG: hypothetical protein C3F12_05820 [Candidatus Methylomirabilota bacterium]|nr:class I SAM-dependent methyltransferase [Candidatus Methylomirabilis sp.]NJD67311.1 class I SAM-dependent methyltransferase [candidate division NC10 bacterium]PWB47484.1 MAG: hypothetical protein C3F12_05820 [candidate division NC10 bacterium]
MSKLKLETAKMYFFKKTGKRRIDGAITFCEAQRDPSSPTPFLEIRGFVDSDTDIKHLICSINGSAARTFQTPYDRQRITGEATRQPGRGFLTFVRIPPALGDEISISIEAEDDAGHTVPIARLDTSSAHCRVIEEEGFSSELTFWKEAITARKHLEPALSVARSKEQYQYYYPEFLLNFVHRESPVLFPGEALLALDVGSGPFSQLIGGQVQGLFQITAIDPLAREYVALMETDGLFREFPVKPIYGTGETLMNLFGEESFHIAYIGNALDHTQDPSLTIDNIYRVLKKNGIFMVIFYENEGTTEWWRGLHQYDLSLDGSYIRCTNKFGDSCLITDPHIWTHIYSKDLDYESNAGRRLLGVAFRKD